MPAHEAFPVPLHPGQGTQRPMFLPGLPPSLVSQLPPCPLHMPQSFSALGVLGRGSAGRGARWGANVAAIETPSGFIG
ncbi:hypothetical protein BJF83_18720 [Nocardiopsis sp. CNR-923]|nr:hypothetical protein BJF83_18720 [Nocardiopsis sp. CNR-923]